MKKFILLLVSLLMLMSLCACSGSKEGSNGGSPAAVNEKAMNALVIKEPEGYTSLEKYSEVDSNGAILEKDLIYNFEDGRVISYAYMPDQKLEEITGGMELESVQVDGQTAYLYDSGSEHLALIQVGDDLYAFDYTLPNEEGKEPFDEVLNSLSFGGSDEVVPLNTDLFAIRYTVDPALNVQSNGCRIFEDAKGDMTEKRVHWYYGPAGGDDYDFALLVDVFLNTTLEEKLYADREYKEETINGVTYSVSYTSDDVPYEYYTQHGDDVYLIRNNGHSTWLSVTRSEESIAAMAAFMESISFE